MLRYRMHSRGRLRRDLGPVRPDIGVVLLVEPRPGPTVTNPLSSPCISLTQRKFHRFVKSKVSSTSLPVSSQSESEKLTRPQNVVLQRTSTNQQLGTERQPSDSPQPTRLPTVFSDPKCTILGIARLLVAR